MATRKMQLSDLRIDQDTLQMLISMLALHGRLEIDLADDGKAFMLFKTVIDDPSLSFDEWFWGGHHHGGCSG